MDKVLFFDYCAFMIIIVISVSMLTKGMVRGMLNRSFLIMVGALALTIIADIFSVHFDNIKYDNLNLRYFVHSLYLFLHAISPLLYVIYVSALTDSWIRGRLIIVRRVVLITPILVVLGVIISNIYTHNLFYINETGKYTRGKLFIVLYMAAACYIIFGFLKLFIYRKVTDKNRMTSLIVFLVFVILAVIIQYFRKELLVEMFANALGLLFILLMVQKPEELYDSETGLHKFDAFVRVINKSITLNNEKNLILINITNYFALRDMLGYNRRREAMRVLAKHIADTVKNVKIQADIFHLDNGQFAIVLHEGSTEEELEKLGIHINSELKNPLNIGHMEINLQACVCATSSPGEFDDFDMLYSFFNELDDDKYTGSLLHSSDIFKKERYNIMKDIDVILENALSERKFMVYYQPIYNIKEKKFTSAEALIRLNDEKYGFISPEIFIPAAEKSGAIHRIGSYVLDEVCRFIATDEFKYLGLEYIEINLSVVECMQSNLIAKVMPILDQYSVAADQVNLEITETAVGGMQSTMHVNIEALHDSGLSFSLDDFGTGYSNMQRIASLPLSIIKIDRTLANSITTASMKVVVENTIKMIKSLSMKIVVEGVETKEMADYFAGLDCDYIQGYYYSKPLPQNEFVKFIRDNLKVSS